MASNTLQQAFAAAAGLAQAGRLAEARAVCLEILSGNPDNADALNLLGAVLARLGRHDEAIQVLERAAGVQPNMPEVCYNLGNVLKEAGRFDRAAVAYRRAIELRPEFPHAYNNLGNVLQARGEHESAVAAYGQAIASRPEYPQAYCNLGSALKATGDAQGAAVAYRRATELRPGYAEAHSNLSSVLVELGHVEDAVECARKAIALDPRLLEAHCNLGNALRARGEHEAATNAFRQALLIKPDFAKAKWNIAWTLLLQGDFEAGWPLYEQRWETEEFGSKSGGLAQPLWDGSDLAGRRILLRCEQGLGDTLQFVRYAQRVQARGGRVIMQCPAVLKRLLQTVPGIEHVITSDEVLPPFDVHLPLLSLPGVFGTTLRSVPANVPYLFPDPDAEDYWRAKLRNQSKYLKIGIVWAGNPRNPRDRERSLRLNDFAPLAHVAGGRFYSLQKGEPARQALQPPVGITLIDWTDELRDFADTAAMLANLDLLITCDTSMAHLAGAMGKQVWTLVSYNPDWRWLLGRSDSPWYPTMRLFRQPRLNDWESVMREVAEKLKV